MQHIPHFPSSLIHRQHNPEWYATLEKEIKSKENNSISPHSNSSTPFQAFIEIEISRNMSTGWPRDIKGMSKSESQWKLTTFLAYQTTIVETLFWLPYRKYCADMYSLSYKWLSVQWILPGNISQHANPLSSILYSYGFNFSNIGTSSSSEKEKVK